MSALEFLLNGRKEVSIAHFNHSTSHSAEAEDFVVEEAKKMGLSVYVGYPRSTRGKNESQEAYWHRERHAFFEMFSLPVVLAHHLSDAAEWWVFSAFRGNPSLMPVHKPNSNIIRPFLLSTKSSLHRFSTLHHIEDPSNKDIKYARNMIRHNIMPEVVKVNPGIETTVRNLYND